MRRLWILCLIIGGLVACVSAEPEPGAVSPDNSAAQTAAVARLAQTLGLTVNEIRVVNSESIDWPNGCLGFSLPNVRCTQVIVPGFRFTLEAGGMPYEVRTDRQGDVVFSTLDTVVNEPVGAAEVARRSLATALGLSVEQVRIVSSEAQEWSDGCLGISRPGLMCAQVITPGYFVILQAQGRQYEYHTDADGRSVAPATRGLTFQRQGGIAGFCDDLSIYLPNEVYAASCKPSAMSGQGALDELLSAEELAQFNTWLDTLAPVTIERQDPAVADAMTLSLTLMGSGAQKPSATDEQELLDWAQMLLTRLQP